MSRRVCIAAIALSLASSPLWAQQRVSWTVRGDTAGAPAGCSAAAAIAGIDAWFGALRDADSARLARTTAQSMRSFVYSTGKFTPADTHVALRTVPQVVRYARTRARQRERIQLQAVKFNGWRGQIFQFGLIYFRRTADDLGSNPRDGVGKGVFLCGQGVWRMNLAPRPEFDPGPDSVRVRTPSGFVVRPRPH